ncbi:MAG: type III-A CRISPR-associated protein Cas10/Csm1 [Tissierellia bacterium]|nr:type III-A CRISPR-associated protein Cas10/Csm1 [Tissierellia bacterium]
MNESKLKLILGALLHDIGKILSPASSGNHSLSGYIFLKNEAKIRDTDILDQVLYHHEYMLKDAPINNSSNAYIAYIANNIATGLSSSEDTGDGFGKKPLQSVFNILNGNQQKYVYKQETLDGRAAINYPTESALKFTPSFYEGIKNNIKQSIESIEIKEEYINSLLEVLEANLSFVPSSNHRRELADISLYDHLKMTAALATCIADYLQEKEINNNKATLYDGSKEFLDEKVFILYSMDISGIQDFIYTISSKGALKSLRSRSFYLEIMLEHLIDELISYIAVSRANLIYSGGGHAYILLANTKSTKEKIQQYENSIKKWFMEVFKTSLYVAGGYSICSANDLKNQPAGSYKNIFIEISKDISSKKLHRYNSEEILYFNNSSIPSGERECNVCKRTDMLTEESKCEICEGLERMSTAIINDEFFTILNKANNNSLPLPANKFLISDKRESLTNRINDYNYIRCYGKNKQSTGVHLATRLWLASYNKGSTFEDLAKSSEGIKRIGVLRADVDNLGQAFVSGFESEILGDKYLTLSRTATFSRKLSMFFKLHINNILENGQYYLSKNRKKAKRNATIVYSGGDDLFIVGSWDDIIGFAIDLYKSFKKYSQNTMTISAGIGIYHSKYPVVSMAKEVGLLEEKSKSMENKNSITLFSEENCYSWDCLIENVLGEKFQLIKEFFDNSHERGKNFLYNILELLRNKEEKINLARYAYLLARLEPDAKAEAAQKKLYKKFSKQMYLWMQKDEDCRQLITAIYIYGYLSRKEGDEDNG